jgi:hypothetical protein
MWHRWIFKMLECYTAKRYCHKMQQGQNNTGQERCNIKSDRGRKVTGKKYGCTLQDGCMHAKSPRKLCWTVFRFVTRVNVT